MKRIFTVAVGVVVLTVVWFASVAAQAPYYVQQVPPSAFQPPAIVVKAIVPEKAQICAEPYGGGTFSCRSVAEFREWVRQRK